MGFEETNKKKHPGDMYLLWLRYVVFPPNDFKINALTVSASERLLNDSSVNERGCARKHIWDSSSLVWLSLPLKRARPVSPLRQYCTAGQDVVYRNSQSQFPANPTPKHPKRHVWRKACSEFQNRPPRMACPLESLPSLTCKVFKVSSHISPPWYPNWQGCPTSCFFTNGEQMCWGQLMFTTG